MTFQGTADALQFHQWQGVATRMVQMEGTKVFVRIAKCICLNWQIDVATQPSSETSEQSRANVFSGTKARWLPPTNYFTLQHIPIHHLDKCISQNWFFSLQFDKCICLYYKMYLYKLTNVFLQSAQCICNSACHLLCSAAPFGQSSFHKKSFCVTYFLSNRLFVVHHRVKRWFASKESAQKNSILKWWDFTHV